MGFHFSSWRGRAGPWAAAIGLALFATRALAGDPVDPAGGDDAASLRAQVARLTALVEALSKRDQEQIQSLAAEVAALRARQGVATATVGSGDATAQPRATQNASPRRLVEETTGAPDAQVAQPRIVQNAARRFQLQSADGAYSIGLTGDIQFDSGAYVGFHPDSAVVGPRALSNGVNARRARIGVTGTAGGNFAFALVYDAGNSSDQTPKGIETAQIIYNGMRGAALEVGYSNTFFTLDQSTGSNDTLFLERASASNIATNFNAGDARANAGFRLFGNRYWLGGYLTGPASGDSHTLTGERLGAFQRVAVQALSGRDYSAHIGFGVDELLRAPNTGNGTANALSLSDQPELRIDPTTFLNTGPLGTPTHPVTGGHVFDVETAATYRTLFWQGEYYSYGVDRLGLASDHFNGGYGQISWTLTGEHHAYNPQAASYFRIFPAHPFSPSHGEWGAWELAARVSYVNLDSNFVGGTALSSNPASVDGGIQRGYTVGLNWYPNDMVRFLLDYNHVVYSKANGVAVTGAPLGVPVGARFDAVSLRAQIAY
jgi:phosphate-selective porin OprO/OprP